MDAHHHSRTSSINAPHQTPPPPLPRVIIVGGGLGGLLLAIILEQVGIPYTVFERSSEIKPLGKMDMSPSRKTSIFRRDSYDNIPEHEL